MKTFLMFADRDFESQQPLPPNSSDLIQDLELNVLLGAMAQKDEFLLKTSKTALLASLTDLDAILYRQEVMKDCLNNPEVVRALYRIPIEAFEKKRHSWLGVFTHSPGSVLSSAVNLMFMFVTMLRQLRTIADENASNFHSTGFSRFFSMIQEELGDEYLDTVEHHLRQLKRSESLLISALLGPGNEGTGYTLRLPNPRTNSWIVSALGRKAPVFSFTISDRDDAGMRALGDLKDAGVNAAANALAQAADHIEVFLDMLRHELAFYVGCLNLKETLDSTRNPITFPTPHPLETRSLSFQGLYDVGLALTLTRPVVGNNLELDSTNLVVITGANQGGKSTFLRSVGVAQLMLQAGMFVPATMLEGSLCRGVFTHYKRKEDASMKSGKLDEELGRMSAIVDKITPNATILFNESFAATNEREGSEIARQITKALVERQIRVFFVTHMYEFARNFFEDKTCRGIFLQAERKAGGKRTYQLAEGEPSATSFAEDIYQQVFGENTKP